MKARILEPKEWERLFETELPVLLPFTAPERAQVVVVEEGDRIVGAWAVLTVVHLEGFWLAPEYRRNRTGVDIANRLITLTKYVARKLAPWAITNANDDNVRSLIQKTLRAQRLAVGDTFAIDLGE